MKTIVWILAIIALSNPAAHASSCNEPYLASTLSTMDGRIALAKRSIATTDANLQNLGSAERRAMIAKFLSTTAAGVAIAAGPGAEFVAMMAGGFGGGAGGGMLALLTETGGTMMFSSMYVLPATYAGTYVIAKLTEKQKLEFQSLSPEQVLANSTMGQPKSVSTAEIKRSMEQFYLHLQTEHVRLATEAHKEQKQYQRKFYDLGWNDSRYIDALIRENLAEKNLWMQEQESLTIIRKNIAEMCSEIDQATALRDPNSAIQQHSRSENPADARSSDKSGIIRKGSEIDAGTGGESSSKPTTHKAK